MTKKWLVEEIEEQLHDYLCRDGCRSLVKRLAVSLAPDGESIVVSVDYQDGCTSRTIFEGSLDANDVDDIIAVTVEELACNISDVADQMAKNMRTLQVGPHAQFSEVTHQRGAAPRLPWEGNWMPALPFPSIR